MGSRYLKMGINTLAFRLCSKWCQTFGGRCILLPMFVAGKVLLLLVISLTDNRIMPPEHSMSSDNTISLPTECIKCIKPTECLFMPKTGRLINYLPIGSCVLLIIIKWQPSEFICCNLVSWHPNAILYAILSQICPTQFCCKRKYYYYYYKLIYWWLNGTARMKLYFYHQETFIFRCQKQSSILTRNFLSIRH